MEEKKRENETIEGIEVIEETFEAEDLMFGRCPASSRCCK